MAPRQWWKSPMALIFGGQVTGSCDHFKGLLGRGDEQDHIYLGTAHPARSDLGSRSLNQYSPDSIRNTLWLADPNLDVTTQAR
jgi:hypothetical protein